MKGLFPEARVTGNQVPRATLESQTRLPEPLPRRVSVGVAGPRADGGKEEVGACPPLSSKARSTERQFGKLHLPLSTVCASGCVDSD